MLDKCNYENIIKCICVCVCVHVETSAVQMTESKSPVDAVNFELSQLHSIKESVSKTR